MAKTMKTKLKQGLALLLAFVFVAAPVGSVAAAELNDLKADAYYYDSVMALVEEGSISGYEDGSFKPADSITRAEASKILVGAKGYKEVEYEGSSAEKFTDVNENQSLAGYIATAFEKGYFEGYADGTFKPDNDITRAQAASVIVRAFELEEGETDYTPFPDVEVLKDDAPAKDDIKILASNGVVKGLKGGNFGVNDEVQRAEFATMVVRARNIAEAPVELKVVSVSAIDANGVTVTFAELKEDLLAQTVEVKDSKGDVYTVKAGDLAEGSKSYTFEFVTSVASAKLVGVWTVDGVTFDLDLATNLAAFVDAGTDQIKLNKALADLGIKNVKVDNMKAYADAHANFLDELAKEDKEVNVEAIQGFVNEVNTDKLTNVESKAIAKKVNEAIEAENDVALLVALQDPAFVRVNADWLTGLGSYKAAIVAETTATNKDEVKEIQGLINGVNTGKVGAVTQTGIDKTELTKAKNLVTTYNTPDDKGEQTTETKNILKAINTQLALVDVLEATTPNNFKAKLTTLAGIVNPKTGTAVVDMKEYVDANGKAYIDALKAKDLADIDKDTVAEVVAILFADNTGVNDKEAGKLVDAVKAEAIATTVDADKLVKALNNLGLKQVATTNKDLYKAEDGFKTIADKDAAQELVDTQNLAAVSAADKDTIIAKLNVFGLDNVVVANAEAYVTAGDTKIVVPAVGSDNKATVTAIKTAVDNANKAITVAAQVKAINEAKDVATVKTALDALANVDEVVGYLKVRSADRDYVAAYVLKNRPEAKYTDIDEIAETVFDLEEATGMDGEGNEFTYMREVGAVGEYKDALNMINSINVNNSIDWIVEALEGTLDEAYNDLSNTAKVTAAEAFYDKLTFNEYGQLKTPFVSLSAVKALLK